MSFNPCSLGCRSESLLHQNCFIMLYKFQSLFSWMSLWKALIVAADLFPPKVSILVLLDVALKVYYPGDETIKHSNVSILVLLDVALKAFFNLRYNSRAKRFQSLFSWMSLWKVLHRYRYRAPRDGFNPCSLGCRSESWFNGYFTRQFIYVSILVLLDVALKENPLENWISLPDVVSILVLLDVALKVFVYRRIPPL